MKGLQFLTLLLLFSCEKKVKKNPERNVDKPKVENTTTATANDSIDLFPWFQYYQKENADFTSASFNLKQTSPISFQNSSISILNEKGFNEVYKPFLIFNKSKNKYLDFDSYQWFLQPDGSAGFEADQQVVLVDYKKKEARQIAFFGPSY